MGGRRESRMNTHRTQRSEESESLSSIIHLPWFPDAFALAVLFLCATAACSRFFTSCAFTKVGAFSHGLDLCTISFRFDVISFAANDCVRGIPYLIRYAFPSNPCSFRCRTDNCLKLALHSRHVT